MAELSCQHETWSLLLVIAVLSTILIIAFLGCCGWLCFKICRSSYFFRRSAMEGIVNPAFSRPSRSDGIEMGEFTRRTQPGDDRGQGFSEQFGQRGYLKSQAAIPYLPPRSWTPSPPFPLSRSQPSERAQEIATSVVPARRTEQPHDYSRREEMKSSLRTSQEKPSRQYSYDYHFSPNELNYGRPSQAETQFTSRISSRDQKYSSNGREVVNSVDQHEYGYSSAKRDSRNATTHGDPRYISDHREHVNSSARRNFVYSTDQHELMNSSTEHKIRRSVQYVPTNSKINPTLQSQKYRLERNTMNASAQYPISGHSHERNTIPRNNLEIGYDISEQHQAHSELPNFSVGATNNPTEKPKYTIAYIHRPYPQMMVSTSELSREEAMNALKVSASQFPVNDSYDHVEASPLQNSYYESATRAYNEFDYCKRWDINMTRVNNPPNSLSTEEKARIFLINQRKSRYFGEGEQESSTESSRATSPENTNISEAFWKIYHQPDDVTDGNAGRLGSDEESDRMLSMSWDHLTPDPSPSRDSAVVLGSAIATASL